MRPATKTSYVLILYFLFAVLVYFLESRNTFNFLHIASQKIFESPRESLFRTKISLSEFISFSFFKSRENEINTLGGKVGLLESEIASLKTVEEQNTQMRKLLDTALPLRWKFSPARVISGDSDTLILSGEVNPSVGQTVLHSNEVNNSLAGIYVGRVEKVVGQEVQVDIATHTSSKIPVIVRDGTTKGKHASGILLGRGGKLLLDQVLVGETLKEGDLVLTNGEAGYPNELLVGFVSKVVNSHNSAVQQAEVRSAIDAKKLDYVFYLVKY